MANEKLTTYARMAEVLVGQLGDLPQDCVRRAEQVLAAGAISIVDGDAYDLPEGAFSYHVEVAKVPAGTIECATCPITSGALASGNGIVLAEGQEGLFCSQRACDYAICPLALAACLMLTRAANVDELPVWRPGMAEPAAPAETPASGDGAGEEGDLLAAIAAALAGSQSGRAARTSPTVHPSASAGDAPTPADGDSASSQPEESAEGSGQSEPEPELSFRQKWEPRTTNSEAAFNLLESAAEDDFYGVAVGTDRDRLDHFVAELHDELIRLEKIEDQQAATIRLIRLPDQFPLREGKLYVIGRLGDINQVNALFKSEVNAELGHVVDNHYVLLVGTQAEVDVFFEQMPGLVRANWREFHLRSLSEAEFLKRYRSNLEEDLARQFDDDERWSKRLSELLREADAGNIQLPADRRECADVLAKLSNERGKLYLPPVPHQETLDEILDSFVGLEQVKTKMRELQETVRYEQRMAAEGKSSGRERRMHMVFMGNPGTGKTMVARKVAQMLYAMGALTKGTCIETSPKDLIAEYHGQTAAKTYAKVREAMGGVLFVDEAYGLYPAKSARADGGASYGTEALEVLLKAMEDYADRLVVIFAGYEQEMHDLIAFNPGMKSRIGYEFHFDDYTPDELLEIFHRKLADSELSSTEETDLLVRDLIRAFSHFKTFGNGRFVSNLVSSCVSKHANRVIGGGQPDDGIITADDVPTQQDLFNRPDWVERSPEEELDRLVGMKDLKEKVRMLAQTQAYYGRANRAGLTLPPQNLNMLFTGNPGTGKTTMARIIGQILYDVGIMPSGQFIEVQAKDLISPVSGQTSETVADHIERAMGGVLFIDEAYALMTTGGGDEALAALVKGMSDFRGQFVVIFAGYVDEMRAFVEANPGMASRIGYTFHFEDYETEELMQLFELKVAAAGLRLADDVEPKSRELFKFFHSVEDFGNGRFVENVLQEAIANHAQHVGEAGEEATEDDFDLIRGDDMPTIEQMGKTMAAEVRNIDLEGITEDDYRATAIHEMGHAVCGLALMGTTDIKVVTIEAEGNGALGYVQYERGNSYAGFAKNLEAHMSRLLGGLAAEELAYGEHTNGVYSDLGMATNLAFEYVCSCGMSPAGMVQFPRDYTGHGRNARLDVSKLPPATIEAMNAVLDRALDAAKDAIMAHKDVYDRMVEVLMRQRTISGDEIRALWEGKDGSEEVSNG